MPTMRDLYQSGQLSQYLLWLACGAGVVGLLAVRSLVALSPVAGVAAALLNPDLPHAWRYYVRNGAALRAAALYLFVLISGLYTANLPDWRHEIFRQLPWLGVPLAFTVAVPLRQGQRVAVGALFVLGTAAVGLATLAQFMGRTAAITEAIRLGQNVPVITRVFHIHFGVMLALAFFWGVELQRSPLARPWLRAALLGALAAIVLVLHVLAYRTGLLALYAGLLAAVLRLLWYRRWGPVMGLLGLLVAGPWLGYQLLGPLQQRWGNTRWDISQFLNGRDINDYSLARRLAAWETAVVVVRAHPLLGVAPADANAAMMEQYAWRDFGLRPENRIMIHNQYLHALVGGGVLGLVLWLAVLLGPLVQPGLRQNPYIRHFVVVFGAALCVDSMLELQTGYNLFVFGYGFLVVAAGRATARPQL